ncbi:MAG: hypothetical protein ABI867_09350 [Kofleriaceae bacterium]
MPRASTTGALVAVPSQALTLRDSQLSYMRGALMSPISISAAVFTTCVGIGLAGVLGATIALVGIAAIGAWSTRYAFVRRHLDDNAQVRERCAREAVRVRALRATGPMRLQQYFELRMLVEEIERTDPREAARFELQDLLEHFVGLAVNQRKCLDALRLVGSHDLPLTIPITDANRSKQRREIQTRRMRHREDCLRRIERITDELEATDELVRLIAQRVACPAIEPESDHEIERRLWELDAVDSAMQQLSA